MTKRGKAIRVGAQTETILLGAQAATCE